MSRPGNADVAKRFGKNLKAVMDSLEMNSAELCRRTGLTPAAISQLISGKREPLLSTVVKIQSVLPVTVERLLK